MNLVLDPSVTIKWFFPESQSKEAVSLKEWIHKESLLIAVPELFFSESANVLWKKSILKKEISYPAAKDIFLEILNLPFQTILDRQILTPAYEIASHHAITIYDAIYLASAYYFHAKFVTADIVLFRRLESTKLSKFIVPLINWECLI